MGYPKALLDFHGRTFLESILDATEALGIKRRLVVLGPDADKVLEKHNLARVTVITTERFEAGPIGSIRASVRAIQAHPVDGLLVWPVDMPHVKISTVESVLDTFSRTDGTIAVPQYQGRRGHPVVFGRSVFDELLDAPDDEGARVVVRANAARVEVVEVDDSAVVEDLNTPESYKRLMTKEDAARE